MNDRPFILVLIWWIFWHVINYIEVIDIKAASTLTNIIYLMMYISMVLGYYSVKIAYSKSFNSVIPGEISTEKIGYFFSNKSCYIYLTISLIVLFFGLYKSEAFSLGFTDYFLKIRGIDALGDVTGISALDNVIKIIIVPMIVASSVFEMNRIKNTNKIYWRSTLWAFINILAFTYLFQVNYVLILILFLIFFHIVDDNSGNIYRSRHAKFIFLSVFVLVSMSAINRYGSFDVLGVILYYPATYFSLSFSLFDYNLNSESIMHEYTYGLSFLGYFSVLPFIFFKSLGLSEFIYIPTALENVTHNNSCVFLGGYKCYNAFGSVAFSLYRDFGVLGIVSGGFLYGFTVSYFNFIRRKSYIIEMCYFYLLAMGVIGIMVSPFDLPYFWFVFILIFVYSFRIKRFVK
jgi:hypothetical protein